MGRLGARRACAWAALGSVARAGCSWVHLRHHGTLAGGSVLHAYRQLVDGGSLEPDPSQAAAAGALWAVERAWSASYSRSAAAAAGGAETERSGRPGFGAYVVGDVGSGKSMLADLLVGSARARPGASQRGVRRQHFHEFMVDVHSRLHAAHAARPRAVAKALDGQPVHRFAAPDEPPLEVVAKGIAAGASLLVLDELQVNDVADALVLHRLFARLMDKDLGVWAVFTSNTEPADLYKGGLNRRYFLPFVELLETRCARVPVGTGVDYRELRPGAVGADGVLAAALKRVAAPGSFRVAEGAGALDAAWDEAVADAPVEARELVVAFGRTLGVARAAGPAARLTFHELCGRRGDGVALGATDYIALASAFRTLLLEGVPRLRPRQRQEARRLVLLLDALYEERVTLHVASECAPDELFGAILASEPGEGDDDGVPPLTEEERTACRRAVSRLRELAGA